MVDIARAYSEVRSLPDEALQKEMQSPSGMIPGYLVMGELSDRQAMRSGAGGFAKKPTIAQQIASGFKAPERLAFSEGGLVNRLNPFLAKIEAMQNPEAAGAAMQEKINEAFNGQPPLSPLMGAQPLGNLIHNRTLVPQQPGTPEQLGGIAQLMRR